MLTLWPRIFPEQLQGSFLVQGKELANSVTLRRPGCRQRGLHACATCQSRRAPHSADSASTVLKFLILFEQETVHLHVAQGSTNYVARSNYCLLTFPKST